MYFYSYDDAYDYRLGLFTNYHISRCVKHNQLKEWTNIIINVDIYLINLLYNWMYDNDISLV